MIDCRKYLLLLTVLTSLSVDSLFAQFTKDCSQQLLPINVINKDNNRVAGLTAKDFLVTLNNRQVSLSLASTSGAPGVLILLDVSSSMAGTRSAAEGSVFEHLLKILPGKSPVAVMAFSDTPILISDFSLDRNKAALFFSPIYANRKKWKPRTEITLAIEKAIDVFAASGMPGNIVLISDGEGSTFSSSEISRKFIKAGVRMFALLWDPARERAIEERLSSTEYLKEMVEKSGGTEFWNTSEQFSSHVQDVAAIDQEMVGRIAHPYLLRLELPSPRKKWDAVKIKISDQFLNGRKLRLEYPHELPPCIQ